MEGAVRVALVDDEEAPRAIVASHLHRYSQEHGERFQISSFSSGVEFTSPYRADYDIIFLDVQMPGLDGFDTARRIRNLDSEVVIVFVTNMASHAIRGYEVQAMNYLVKPVKYFPFSHEVRRAVHELRRYPSAAVMLNTAEGSARVEISSLVYLESDRHRITIHALDRKYELTGTLKHFEAELDGKGFFRSNNGYLVNLRHVVGVQDSRCLMRTGEQLQISRTRRRSFMDALAEHMRGAS
ncbi:LytR/AlgR family response regulator transcription factor [Nesterenkonia haasae]|uniref:LytR/AlgR family response regulator transcription factor n=1 Tax=Nesterenkonia haasae TaxID=2587813 RepID=UPI001391C229|nr:LytTR family DNA-binding domain-containing protein [Nesterenkonia haasae]